MYLTYNEGKSIYAERFIRTLKGKYNLGYLNKLVGEYNNTYHYSIDKRPFDADYSAVTEKFELSHKVPKFNVGDRVKIAKCKNIFSVGYTETLKIGQKKYM